MRKRYLFELQREIRHFFCSQDFLEVSTPPVVPNPGMEVHIHPFQLQRVNTQEVTPFYLQTSPEFYMKELLSEYEEEQFQSIFNMSYCFRDEPSSPHHRFQFLMLEWYRVHESYTQIMEDVKSLVSHCWKYFANTRPQVLLSQDAPTWKVTTIEELFESFCKFNILNFLNFEELYQKVQSDFPDIQLQDSTHYDWDDLFFLLFLNKIEPEFRQIPYLIVDKYPAPLSALSTIDPLDGRVCQRFEAYISGIELCNCFNELTDVDEQKRRFTLANENKKRIYNYDLPSPQVLLNALEKGLPPSSGIALGVERLLQSLTKTDNPFYA